MKDVEPRRARPPIEQIAHEFDLVAPIYDRLPLAANSSTRFVRYRLSNRRWSALDVGCGTGRTVCSLKGEFKHLFGVDVAAKMLAVAKKRCLRRRVPVRLARMDTCALGFGDETFDFVLLHTVLHHLEAADLALVEVRRVIRRGGRLLIVDILAEKVTGHAPIVAAYLAGALGAGKTLFTEGFESARSTWHAATSSEWLAHQRGECFLDERDFRAQCSRVFPGASISKRAGEFGLTSFVVVEWEKPA